MSRRVRRGGISYHALVLASMGLAFVLATFSGCGKKGTPVPPARPVAAPAPTPEATEEREQPEIEERRRIKPPPPP